MKLHSAIVSVQLSDYKCIRKLCQFDVSDITCLVGKNESGKTAIFEALYRFIPIIRNHGDFNADDDYPRIDVEDYGLEVAGGQSEPAVVTRATFALEEEDLKSIEADFPGIIAQPELVLSKGYANELYAELTINEDAVVTYRKTYFFLRKKMKTRSRRFYMMKVEACH